MLGIREVLYGSNGRSCFLTQFGDVTIIFHVINSFPQKPAMHIISLITLYVSFALIYFPFKVNNKLGDCCTEAFSIFSTRCLLTFQSFGWELVRHMRIVLLILVYIPETK